jgi:hypothetical protein
MWELRLESRDGARWRSLRPELIRVSDIFSAISWFDSEAGFEGRFFFKVLESFWVDIFCDRNEVTSFLCRLR